MIDKFFNWLFDYQSGRFIITLLIIGLSWVINAYQCVDLLFDKNEGATKQFIIKCIGLIPPCNLLTVWF